MGKGPKKLIASITHQGFKYKVNLEKPIDLTRNLDPFGEQTRCFSAPAAHAEPAQAGDFVLSLENGSPVNSYNLFTNIHGNGTHTETARHVDKRGPTIAAGISQYLWFAPLVRIVPESIGDDLVITREQLEKSIINYSDVSALIVSAEVPSTKQDIVDFSNQNPPYFLPRAIEYLVESGVKHLITDLPSVDKEQDGGKVASHHQFWDTKNELRKDATITELVKVPSDLREGFYFLQLTPMKIALDAAMSRVVVYEVIRDDKIIL